MADIHAFISLGIGSPASIKHFILVGLSPGWLHYDDQALSLVVAPAATPNGFFDDQALSLTINPIPPTSGAFDDQVLSLTILPTDATVPEDIPPSGLGYYTIRIEGEFAPGVWTSFGSDVVGPTRLVRGNSNNSPHDNVAESGVLDFILRNDKRNVARIRGHYSPNNLVAVRPGFVIGMGIRVIFKYNIDFEATRWTGKLKLINPTAGQFGQQVAQCQATDFIDELAGIDVRSVTRQINQNEHTLFDALLDTLPTESQPRAREIDEGLYVFPVAFDDIGSGTGGLAAAERIATSALGHVFVTGDGTFRYMNNVNSSLSLPSFIFGPTQTKLRVPSDLDNVYNRVRLTEHPRSFSPAVVVLTSFSGSLELAAGAQEEFWLTYRDPADLNTSIGGTDFVLISALAGDYLFNAASDGTGTNLTSSIVVSVDFLATTAKVTITNNATVTAFKQVLQLRGIAIYDRDPVTVEAYTPRSYDKAIDLDLPYLYDLPSSRALASFIEATYRDLADQVLDLTFYPQGSEELMYQAMTLEIGQVIGCSDPQILPNGTLCVIQLVEMIVDAEGVLTVRLGTAPWIVQAGMIGDTVNLSDTLIYLAVAPETRVGYAVVGFSEAA